MRPRTFNLRALLVVFMLLGGAACAPVETQDVAALTVPTTTRAPTLTPVPAKTQDVASLSVPTTTRAPTLTPVPTLTSLPTVTLFPTATPDPFAPYYIETLAARRYGEGNIEVGALLEETDSYQRFAFSYPSEGLRITGNLTLPKGTGPFPVLLLNHGYYPPESYRTGDGTWDAAAYLARHGYLTLASDYRNYGGSEHGPNPFRLGFVVDVMNLLASLDTLPAGWADSGRVGMWGHSMGGGVTINAVVLAGEQLDAAVIYAGMSGDMAEATRHVLALWQRPDFVEPVQAWGGPDEQPDAYARMSALNFLAPRDAPLSIHHGTVDEQVPYPWSETLRDRALAAGLAVEFFAYPNSPHNFSGDTWLLFMERATEFFDREVAGR